MKKQKFWDCHTTGDDSTRKAYTKDGKQRMKVTRTITRDCATGIADDDNINEASDAGDDIDIELEERTLEKWLDNPELIRSQRLPFMANERTLEEWLCDPNLEEEVTRYLPIIREEVRRYLRSMKGANQ